MCGLFGVTQVSEKDLFKAHSARDTLTHRGPDAAGFFLADNVYLGHRRLTIIDLSDNGIQPLTTLDKQLAVCLNGEIYNYRELRTELEIKGYTFKSNTDTEVLLHGYLAWGLNDLLNKIEGMFAIVFFDRKAQKIHLVRDPVGIKPLYWGIINGQLSWASELKALTHFYGKENLKIDNTAVYDFLTYLHIPAPKSLYQHIYKLEPGQVITFDLKNQSYTQYIYWEISPLQNPYTNFESAKKAIHQAIQTSVKEQLVTDVPLGFFLSGGLDSSLVCYEAQPHIQYMKTHTISLNDADKDESKYAQRVAEQLKSEHFTAPCPSSLVDANFEYLTEWTDEPFGDLSIFPTSEVSRLTRKNVTVALSGDGGDELFGGYERYQLKGFQPFTSPYFLTLFRPLVSYLRTLCFGSFLGKIFSRLENFTLADPMERHAKILGGMTHHDKKKQAIRKKLGIDINYDDYWLYRKYWQKNLPLATQMQLIDFYSYLQMVLTKVDRASMRHSLEVRVPILCRNVIEAAFNTPAEFIYYKGERKGLLKAIYENNLPPETVRQPRKMGFAIESPKHGEKLSSRKRLQEIILEELFTFTLKA